MVCEPSLLTKAPNCPPRLSSCLQLAAQAVPWWCVAPAAAAPLVLHRHQAVDPPLYSSGISRSNLSRHFAVCCEAIRKHAERPGVSPCC